MSTIKHPDTYVCDLCGKPFDTENKIKFPVIFDEEEYEYGIHHLECSDVKIELTDIDVCDECQSKILKVKGQRGYHRDNTYRIAE